MFAGGFEVSLRRIGSQSQSRCPLRRKRAPGDVVLLAVVPRRSLVGVEHLGRPDVALFQGQWERRRGGLRGERERSDALLRSRRVVLGGGSSSFSSVSTARSPGVSAVVTAIEIRFDGPPPLIDPPVIFEMLYVEKRFDARRSSASLCFSAASEL